ncbi:MULTISPECIES: DUF4328 domain-containing protein [Henriciella]|nr:DUF4328 domain-containing protein [Henriciella pelagia]
MSASTIEETVPPPARDKASRSRKVKPIGNLWAWLKYAMISYIVVDLALMVSIIVTLVFFDRVESGYYATDQDIIAAGTAIDMVAAPLGILYIVLFVLCMFTYARFFHRSMNNVQAVGAKDATMPPGWVWGYFFIPIANLWKPVEGVLQIWRGSMRASGANPKVPLAVGLWWTFWLITTIISNISFRLSISSGAFDDEITDFDLFITTNYLDIVTSVTGVICAVFLLSFASRLNKAQQAINSGGIAETFE